MGQSLNVAQDQISQVAMITQIGFALGLLFIVPLGDKIQRKKLIIFAFFWNGYFFTSYGHSK